MRNKDIKTSQNKTINSSVATNLQIKHFMDCIQDAINY